MFSRIQFSHALMVAILLASTYSAFHSSLHALELKKPLSFAPYLQDQNSDSHQHGGQYNNPCELCLLFSYHQACPQALIWVIADTVDITFPPQKLTRHRSSRHLNYASRAPPPVFA